MMIEVRRKILFILGIIIIIIFANTTVTYGATPQETENSDYVYLSDISYIKDKSFAANGYSIHLNQNDSNDLITLKVLIRSAQQFSNNKG